MKNKFINLLLQEPNFSLKLAVVISLAMCSLYLHRDIGLKRSEISKLSRDSARVQELGKQIVALEGNLRGFEEKGKITQALKRNLNLVLKGIFTQNGESAALINEDIYQKNDTVSGLIITAISANTVTLFDPITAEQSKIQLPE
jgi:hypothetical protein